MITTPNKPSNFTALFLPNTTLNKRHNNQDIKSTLTKTVFIVSYRHRPMTVLYESFAIDIGEKFIHITIKFEKISWRELLLLQTKDLL